MNAVKYLEELQKAYFWTGNKKEIFEKVVKRNETLIEGNFDSPIFKDEREKIFRIFEYQFPNQSENKKIEFYKECFLKQQATALKLPTNFENAIHYGIILEFQDEIETTLKSKNQSLDKIPIIGTFTTKHLNAEAIMVPNSDEFLIVFHWQMFNFCLLASKILGAITDVVKFEKRLNNKNIENLVSSNSKLAERFFQLIYSIVIDGIVENAPQYYLEDDGYSNSAQIISSKFGQNMEMFVLCHEYGHLHHNHHKKEKKKVRKNNVKDYEYIKLRWDFEYEADLYGVKIALETLNKRNSLTNQFNYSSIDSFFTLLSIVEKCTYLVKHGTDEKIFSSSDHPPSLKRRDYLRNKLKEDFGNDILDGALPLQHGLEVLWEIVKPKFEKIYQESNPYNDSSTRDTTC